MKLYLVGGFLGSGKTTAIYNACHELMNKGTLTGVITNDQGNQLVDTEIFRGGKVTTFEVSDGCFCCNYKKLAHHIDILQQTRQSEVIFAESVGSCTDLIATVVKPLLQFHAEIEVILSVFADARVLHALIQGAELFAQSVNYIYKKQLEEADVLVINKIDLLNAWEIEEIKTLIKKEYPDKEVIYQDSLKRDNIRKWLNYLSTFQPAKRKSLELDYDIYGMGEAELAWLDAGINICTTKQDAVCYGITLAKKVYSKINDLQLPIGHLKFLFDDGMQQKKISFTSINQSILKYELIALDRKKIKVLINARVQASPGQLEKIVSDSVRELELYVDGKVIENKIAAFRPSFPKPTYRILN
jgi:Ni2+-binding GTPase involved in maturation of urease and hydrogenase